MRQVSDPEIPEHPLRDRFVGRWFDRDYLAWDIAVDERGWVGFREIVFNGWHVVINEVAWEHDTLCFDQYHYAPDPHPFNGVRNPIRLQLRESVDELWFETCAEEIGKSAQGVLTRGA